MSSKFYKLLKKYFTMRLVCMWSICNRVFLKQVCSFWGVIEDVKINVKLIKKIRRKLIYDLSFVFEFPIDNWISEQCNTLFKDCETPTKWTQRMKVVDKKNRNVSKIRKKTHFVEENSSRSSRDVARKRDVSNSVMWCVLRE